MPAKTSAEVIIGGKVYTLSGYEGEEYLQKVAAYINGKLNDFDEIEETALLRKLLNEVDKFSSVNPYISNSILNQIKGINDLDKLKEHDKIILNINNKTYTYKVTSIWETIKDGTIEVSKQSTNQLILTTCSKKDKNKQLIINSKKES